MSRPPRTILIVPAVLAGALVLLAFLVGFALFLAPSHTRAEKAEVDLALLQDALKLYQVRHGDSPATAAGLTPLVGEILGKVPKDPWGREYQYTNTEGTIVLTTFGADGKPGGRGADADLSRTLTAPRARTSP